MYVNFAETKVKVEKDQYCTSLVASGRDPGSVKKNTKLWTLDFFIVSIFILKS